VLRYSDRVKLLRDGERLGIGRFRANLIIAMVQHARGDRVLVAADVPRDELPGWWSSISGAVAIALAIEVVVAVVSWLWFLG
jgi:hypothetical protein